MDWDWNLGEFQADRIPVYAPELDGEEEMTSEVYNDELDMIMENYEAEHGGSNP